MNDAIQTITSPQTAALLLNPDLMGCLERLLEREWTVSALAKNLGLGLGSVHYRVLQLLEHDLVRVSREDKRAGRSIKHYTASAEGFFVPFALTNFETLCAFWLAILEPKHRAFVAKLVHNAERRAPDPQGWGVVVQNIAEVGLYVHSVPRPEPSIHNPVSWLGEEDLHLSHPQAQAFQLELRALMAKYALEDGPHDYLMQAGLVWSARE